MVNDELLSKTISYLRFPFCAGVVFIHFNLAKGLVIRGIVYGMDNPDWYFNIIRLISEVIASIGVPLFFVFSGFLFFYRKDYSVDVYKSKLKSRIKTLLIPFLLWNTLTIIWKLKCFFPGLSAFFRPSELHVTPLRLFNTYFCNVTNKGIFVGVPPTEISWVSPIDFPLWYVRDLMLMVILSPVIYWLIKKFKGMVCVFFCLIWLFSTLLIPIENYFSMYVNLQFLYALFFFMWGGVL